MYTAQLKQFHDLAPHGFFPFEGRFHPNLALVVELEYRHTDGRRHVLRMNRLTGVVYESRTLDLPPSSRRRRRSREEAGIASRNYTR